MEYITLYNGMKMPLLGFGTYKLSDEKECAEGAARAIDAGYTLIDTASVYGNEKAVGAGIKMSRADRSSLFVATKVWFDMYSEKACAQSVDASLRALGTDYLDIVFLHWPYGDIYSAWRTLEKYVRDGKVRALGISNFEADRVVDFCRNVEIRPAVNQIEINLFSQRKELIKWDAKYNVASQAYAPLGHGKGQQMMSCPEVVAIAEKYGKTPAQVLLRFILDMGAAAIPKTAHESRMKENIDIFDFSLNEQEKSILSGLDRNEPMIGKSGPEKAEEMLK